MAISKIPYWKRKAGSDVVERIQKIKEMTNGVVRTVRNITYKLYPELKGKELENKYNLTVKDTVRARTSNEVPFEAIREVRTSVRDYEGYEDIDDFIKKYTIENLDRRYARSRRPSHLRKFEIWFEKETVETEFESVCAEYDVPYLDIRGQAQWSTLKKSSERLTDEHTVIYFGDNDEKGKEIFDVFIRALRFLKCKATFVWAGLNDEHEEKYGLPRNSRIDGLDLDDLKDLIETEIQKHIDIDKYEQILEQERKDKEYLKDFKAVIVRK